MIKETRKYTVKIHLKDGSTAFTVKDTDTSYAGTAAKEFFTQKTTVVIPGETADCKIYIPYDSILYVEICAETTSEEVEDNTCIPYTDACGPSTDNGGEDDGD